MRRWSTVLFIIVTLSLFVGLFMLMHQWQWALPVQISAALVLLVGCQAGYLVVHWRAVRRQLRTHEHVINDADNFKN